LVIAAVLPTAPGLVTEFASSSSHVEIRWSVPLSNGGANITDYRIYWDAGRGDNIFDYLGNTVGYLNFIATQEKSSDFMAGLWYTFKVTAINSIGEGPATESIAILAAQPPSAPALPTLLLQTPTQITIRWVAPDNRGSPIRDFHVYMDSGHVGELVLLTPSAGGPNVIDYTITDVGHGILTGAIYDFVVSATNDKGESDVSPILENIMAAQLSTPPLAL
jgi:hypothetical protein